MPEPSSSKGGAAAPAPSRRKESALRPADGAEDAAAREFAVACARAASDKKAGDVAVLDLRGISGFTDFFVICSGSSEPQLKAIASALREAAHLRGRKIFNEDGFPASQWVALDFGEVIAHVFHGERRSYYDLESLWRDAPRVDWETAGPA